MKTEIHGNRIILTIDKESEKSSVIPISLPDGYSVKSLMWHTDTPNVIALNDGSVGKGFKISPMDSVITFPVVNLKSPCFFLVETNNAPTNTSLVITITEYGGVPWTQYFSGTFLPISAIDPDNGSKYNMIPSTQFER